MSYNTTENNHFPLVDAIAIIPTEVNSAPENVDLIYTVVVDAPGQDIGQFGPVKAWKDTSQGDGVWRMCAPHSLECLPDTKVRLKNLVESEAWGSSGAMSSILLGMVEKNDYSWDSLVRAYNADNIWARNIIGLIQETFAQASMLWWVEFPAIDSSSARALIALSEVDNTTRTQLYPYVEKYMIASSIMDDYQSLSHNSSARKGAQYQLDFYTNNLVDALGDSFSHVSDKEKRADDGTVFLS